ncbi:hypothetical protein [Phaeobacter porticola]|uniref:Uncharacterized protein n=1 Tax=Phaeobacter porticola TaxID=1844006 RepID=A0A1L3I0R4_9RHOB|nr:hypothetical protein [Phaeobacter porticola]APG45696.1 hypothetical protein PhaeoP97_00244 [Phaeobacter porticola]
MSNQPPLALSEFWNKLRLRAITFDLPDDQTGTGTGSGEVLRASRRDVLWQGKAAVTLNRHDAQDEIKALMDEIRHGGARFLVSDPKRRGPQSDKLGTLQGNSIATVHSFDLGDRRKLVLRGLPAGFELRAGDLLSIEYGADPVRHFLARIQRGGTFAGNTPKCELRVLPFLPIGLEVGQVVTLRSPVCKASYVPDSYTPIERLPGYDGGFEFKWRQTYR